MFKYRVLDRNTNKFTNIVLKDRVENLTEMRGREFWCKNSKDPRPHLLRIIEGPVEVNR